MASCWCGTDCSGCGWGCAYSCGGCDGNCSGSCKGGCSTACKNTCKTACNTGCTSTEATTLAGITLDGYLRASNITDIARLIYLEAARRSEAPATTSFTADGSVTASEISKVISNLSLAGQTASYSATAGDTIAAALGQDLITKAVAAYNTTINLA